MVGVLTEVKPVVESEPVSMAFAAKVETLVLSIEMFFIRYQSDQRTVAYWPSICWALRAICAACQSNWRSVKQKIGERAASTSSW